MKRCITNNVCLSAKLHVITMKGFQIRFLYGMNSFVIIYYKKNTILLCSASWIHYWTDFDDFGLQMTVKEWSSALSRKNWGFQNASLQKMQFFFRWRHSARQTNLDIFWVPEKFWKPTVALPLFVDLFIQIVDTSALRRGRTVSSIFVILKIKYWFVTLQTIRDTASPKKRGGGGGGGGSISM